MPKKFEIEELVDSLATISDIIFRRLHCMECNQCEPCGPAFMNALKTVRAAGNVAVTTRQHGTQAAAQSE
jgi:hypothetical protein